MGVVEISFILHLGVNELEHKGRIRYCYSKKTYLIRPQNGRQTRNIKTLDQTPDGCQGGDHIEVGEFGNLHLECAVPARRTRRMSFEEKHWEQQATATYLKKNGEGDDMRPWLMRSHAR